MASMPVDTAEASEIIASVRPLEVGHGVRQSAGHKVSLEKSGGFVALLWRGSQIMRVPILSGSCDATRASWHFPALLPFALEADRG